MGVMCQSHGPLPSKGGENPGPSTCPLYGAGGSAPHPSQHSHSSCPVSWQRQQLSNKDQLQPHWWLGWFPSQSPEQTTGPTRWS